MTYDRVQAAAVRLENATARRNQNGHVKLCTEILVAEREEDERADRRFAAWLRNR